MKFMRHDQKMKALNAVMAACRNVAAWCLSVMIVSAFCLLCMTVEAHGQVTEIVKESASAINRAADIASQKDIVWLALVTCIVSMLLTAGAIILWYVSQMKMLKELQGRPCLFAGKLELHPGATCAHEGGGR